MQGLQRALRQVTSGRFAEDGEHFATISRDHSAKVYRRRSGATLSRHGTREEPQRPFVYKEWSVGDWKKEGP